MTLYNCPLASSRDIDQHDRRKLRELTIMPSKSRPAGSGVVAEVAKKKRKKKQKNQFDESNSENSGGVVFELGHSVIL